jgi:phosphoglycolate phosphatase
MNVQHIRTIFFDYDGTIHNSLAIYEPAFLKAYDFLVENNHAKPYDWTSQEISQFLGQTPKEMWNAFGEDIKEDAKNKASKIISDEMQRLILNKQASLYDGAMDTLKYLKSKGYKLIFISNCKQYYLESHAEIFHLDDIFDLMVCSETFEIEEKHLVLERILNDFPEKSVIIGDRHHDIQAGKYNKIYTIGCRYGFGNDEELKEADMTIDTIKELDKIF